MENKQMYKHTQNVQKQYLFGCIKTKLFLCSNDIVVTYVEI